MDHRVKPGGDGGGEWLKRRANRLALLWQFAHKAIGMVEIRLARRMRKRPIRFATVRFFDHRRETEPSG